MAAYVNRVVPEKEQMQFVVSGLKQKGDQYVHNPRDFTFALPRGVGEMGMHRIDSGAVLEEQGRVMGAPSAAVDGVSYPYLYLDKCGPPEEATPSCGPLFAFTRFGPSLPCVCHRLVSTDCALFVKVFGHSLSSSLGRYRYIITCLIYAIYEYN